jgi:hypothetical protein
MNRKTKNFKLWAILAFICLFLFGIGLLMLSPSYGEPRLTVAYADSTNVNGIKVQRFTITNKGTAPVVHAGAGGYEVKPSGAFFSVGYTFQHRRILPAESQIIEVKVPDLPQGEIRYMCLLTRDTLRVRIYDWQWGPNGPGAKANWLVPKFLKAKPMDLRATSVWLNDYLMP